MLLRRLLLRCRPETFTPFPTSTDICELRVTRILQAYGNTIPPLDLQAQHKPTYVLQSFSREHVLQPLQDIHAAKLARPRM